MYKSLQKRILCLLLAMVMTLGMLPASALAVDGEPEVQATVLPAGNMDRPAADGYGSYSGSFTRVTLVEYDFSDHGTVKAPNVNVSDWLSPAKTTSIDIAANDPSGSAQDQLNAESIAGVKHWLTANALDYRKCSTVSEIGKTFESNLQTGSWPVVTNVAMADYVFGNNIMQDIANGGEDVLLGNYRSGQAANSEFMTLLGLFDGKRGVDAGQTATAFFDANSGKSYRVIIEPGVVVTIDNEPWAMTMRDWGAWSLAYFANDKGGKGEYALTINGNDGSRFITVSDPNAEEGSDAALAAGNAPLWFSWFDKFINLAANLRLKSGHDQMATYKWDGMGEFDTANIQYDGHLWKADKTFDDTADLKAMFSDGSVAYSGSDYFISHAFGFQNDRLGQHPGFESEAFGNGVYAGYGMGMLAPYDFPENLHFHTGLTVNYVASGNAALTGAEKTASFIITLTGLKDSDGNVLNGNFFYDKNGVKTKLTVTSGTATVNVSLKSDQTIAFPQDGVYMPAVPQGTKPYGYTIKQTSTNPNGGKTFVSIDGIATSMSDNAISGAIASGSGSVVDITIGTAKLILAKMSADLEKDYTFNVSIDGAANGDKIDYVDADGNAQVAIYNNGLRFVLKSGDIMVVYTGMGRDITVDEVGADGTTLVNNEAYTGPVTVDPTKTGVLSFVSNADAMANIVIDLNFNGADRGDKSPDICNAGLYQVGDVVPEDKLAVKYGDRVLSYGDVLDIASGTCATCGTKYTVTMVFDGLWTEMTGGDMVSGDYKTMKPGVTTLYAHWSPELNQGCNCERFTPVQATPEHSTRSAATRAEPETANTVKYSLDTVTWNQNYTDGGIMTTTSIVVSGSFTLEFYHKTEIVIKTTEDGEDRSESHEYRTVTVNFTSAEGKGTVVGLAAERSGYIFLGWSTHNNWPWGKTHQGKPDSTTNLLHTVEGVIEYVAKHEPGDTDIYYPGDKNHDVHGGNTFKPVGGTVYYATWLSLPVIWNANGGAFSDYDKTSWAGVENNNVDKDGNIIGTSENTNNVQWMYPQGKPFNIGIDSTVDWLVKFKYMEPIVDNNNQITGYTIADKIAPTNVMFTGWVNSNSTIPIVKRIPTRLGYTFTGWYLDKLCTVPLTISEDGVRANRSYYAGWEADTVEITYYDTREGTSVVGTQTYKYGDSVGDLLDGITDTSGQIFNGWQDGPEDSAANSVTFDKLKTTYTEIVDNLSVSHKTYGLNATDLMKYGAEYTAPDIKIVGTGFGPGGITGPVGMKNTPGVWKLKLYANWNQEYQNFYANVSVDDMGDNDACRPKEISIGLVDSVYGRIVKKHTFTVTDGRPTYSHEFTDLPITTVDASVERISYKVIFTGYKDNKDVEHTIKDPHATSGQIEVPSGSDYDTTVAAIYDYAIDNTSWNKNARDTKMGVMSGTVNLARNITTTGEDIKFTIQWDDQSNNDGVRPGAVTLQLYANGTPVQDATGHNSGAGTVSVSAGMCDVSADGNTWTYTFEDYQKYNKGTAIDYKVAVSGIPTGYKVKYTTTGTATGPDKTGVTLTQTPKTANVPVTVKWDDELNRDGQRPEAVDIALYAYQWNDKTYRWEEVLVATKTALTGGSRAAVWATTFADQKVLNGGQEIIYVAKIASDLNAQLPVGANEYNWVSSERDITISHNKNLTSVPATVQWDDHANNDAIRPEAAIIQLYADGVKVSGPEYRFVINGDKTAQTWTHVFENLPKYAAGVSGKEILYTIGVEEAVKDSIYGTYTSMANGEEQILTRYTASYIGAAGATDDITKSTKAWITLTHKIDQGTTVVYASWHDNQNQDNKRPTSIQVDLYKRVDGLETKLETLTLSVDANGSWKYRVAGLPLFENGHAISYFVGISDDYRAKLESEYGYTVSIQDATVHLYRVTESGTITGKIQWDDKNDNDAIRPVTVMASLYANGVRAANESGVIPTIALNAENNWTASWADMPLYYSDKNTSGKPVVYDIRVDIPDGYTVSYIPANTTLVNPTDIVIKLSHGYTLETVPVIVNWNDNSNSDGTRPSEVKVQLKSNGMNLPGKIITVTGTGNVWAGQFENMPTYLNGKPVEYTVVAANPVAEYVPMTAGTVLYLSKDPVTASLSVAFNFDDQNNADGVRPTGLYIQLLADGQVISGADYEYTMNFETDGNKREFNGLPVYSHDGTRIKYSAAVTLDEMFGSVDYQVNVSADRELSTTNSNQITVKLSRKASLGVETGHIYWFDAGNQRGNRPDTLGITVKNDAETNAIDYVIDSTAGEVRDAKGAIVGDVVIIPWGNDNKASCWTYRINGLQQNSVRNGQSYEIRYWAMAKATGISTFYNVLDGEANGLDVNLTHVNYKDDMVSSTQDFKVTVSWLDNQNAWGYRPDVAGIDVKLLANGNVYKTVHLTEADILSGNINAWEHLFENLPTYLEGKGVVYSVSVSNIDKYTETVGNADGSVHTDYAVVSMTQSIGFDFALNWNDSNNDDAVRPTSVTLNVLGDGTQVGKITLTDPDQSNIWTGSIEDLAVWRTVGSGTAVSYKFQWDEATKGNLIDNLYDTGKATQSGAAVESPMFYYLSAKTWGDANDPGLNDLTGQYQAETTLTRNKATRDVSGEIVFQDDENRDGKRPQSLQVQLLADGVAHGQPVEVKGETSTWPVEWTGLDIYKSGKKITYEIQLTEDPADYAVQTDSTGTVITLTRDSELVQVTGKLNWLDDTELHYVYNSFGDLIRTYSQIARTDAYMQLTADGVALGEAIFIPADGYGSSSGLLPQVSYTWADLLKYRDNGTEINYAFQVYSSSLDTLLADGHSLAYDFAVKNNPVASVSHDLYDVRGTVHYLYNTSDDFLLKDANVAAYLYNETTKTYDEVGSAVTDAHGQFEILNLPQGLLTIRATYQDKDLSYAGSVGLKLDRHDGEAALVVDRDAGADSDLYRYTASGTVYYQTDSTDPATRAPVPADSIVLLYRTINGQANAQYVGMTTTDASGQYSFKNLENASYMVSVVFNYNGGTHTYDMADAVKDKLNFVVSGSAVTWPDIVKQVGMQVDPGPEPGPDPEEPVPPEEKPKPCITTGSVFFSDNGVLTTDPVADVDVYIYAADNHALLGHVATDATGKWTKDALAVGDYVAVFSYQGNASRVLVFSVTESDFAIGTLEVQTQYFDRLTVSQTGVIKGVVLGETGSKLSAMVQVLDMNGNLVDFMYTDKAGMYDFTVPAGFGYQIKILNVGSREEKFSAGDPDDAYTALDYYQISGNFSVEGTPQSGSTIAIYQYDSSGEDNLLTATMTDQQGDYSVKLTDAGNYRVVAYRNGSVYEKHNVTVGYQEWEPVVTEAGGKYVISGGEAYESLVLYDRTTNVIKTVVEMTNGTGYAIDNLPAGNYDLRLVMNGQEKHYYIDAPDAKINVAYFVTVSGSVMEDGKAVLGSVVNVYDKATGKAMGSDTVITDGSYAYANLPEGSYEIRIKYPMDGVLLADKTTADADSYGKSYPDGMTDGSVWSWNINAITVSGKITDQTGRPVANAVAILQDVNTPSRAYAAVADENGNWVAGVLAGTYAVDAMFEYDMTHVYHAVEKKTVSVSADVANIGLVIERFKLTGNIVRDSDGAAITGANITVKYADNTPVWSGKTDASGEFELLVFPGDYIVTAEHEKTESSKFLMIKSDADVTIRLGTAMTLSGIVYDTDGVTPVTDGLVHYTGPKSGTVYTDEAGEYAISLVASDAGQYVLYAEAAGNKSAEARVTVNTDVSQNLVLVKSQETGDRVVSGIVTDNDGHRLANAVVSLVYGNDKTKTLTSSTNESGAYRFQVPDGTYYLTAVYTSAAGYTYSTNAETAVHVNGANQTANLAVILAYEVSITVVDENGNIVPDATVVFAGASSGELTTDDAGHIQTRLAGGNYGFQAFVGNRESVVKHVIINKAADITLEVGVPGLKDEPPFVTGTKITIDGSVLSPDGSPVENATVNLKLFDKTTETWSVIDTVFSSSEGYYKFTDLSDGRYAVDVSYEIIETVTAEASAFEINGYALDDTGNPYVGAAVSLYDAEHVLVETVASDETGYYEFIGLAAGEYQVEIIPVGSEAGTTLDVTAQPSNSSISGTVIDVNGNPVTGAIVNVASNSGNWSMTTEADGKYEFDLPEGGDYVVTIVYPYEQVIDTGSYIKNADDANAPGMYEDSFTISGYVHDTDDNILADVTVELWQDTKLSDTVTNELGYYEFTELSPGVYTVVVIWGEFEKRYEVETGSGSTDPGEPDPEPPVTDKIHASGTVITNHKTILAGAVVTVTNLADNSAVSLTADENGMFKTEDLPNGRYEVYAEYTHEYGTNQSDKLVFTRTQENMALVIVLSYQTDLNGKDETVYAGQDDKFDTPDDFYEADVGNDGIKDPVYAGEDGKPGTEDDYYPWDVDGDGEDEKVYVGEDTIPGTPDDWYPTDVDKDGKDEDIFIGDDCIPGTEDDWYHKDVDGDGDDEQVFVGPDTKPGTDDDWYIDNGGAEQPVGVWVRFDANGGAVNGQSVWSVKVSEFKSMPAASRTDYTFNGWFSEATGGTKMLASDVQKIAASTTIYAQWAKISDKPDPAPGPNPGGGGGGGGGGGPVAGDVFTVSFDTKGGSAVADQSVESGKKIAKPTDPVKTGYEFVEWQLNGKAFDFDKAVKSDLTLVATWKHVGVFGLLTSAHIAYVAGFSDGLIHPEANITRAEVAMIFYRLLSESARTQFKTGESSFTDVASNAWYAVAVATLTRMEILYGRGGNKFDPGANITRAEFAVIATRFDSEKLETKLTFQDVPESNWAHDEILQAAAKGWVVGYGDGNFGPDDFISRAEVMTLVNRVLNRGTITVAGMLSDMITWPDNAETAWYYNAVQEATNGHKAEYKDDVESWTELEQKTVGNQ